ncbi:MAG TPA: hypothetical protein VJH92_02015 [Candidatus Nanoarchaeia archaeon]|nr:hypothetical protein [Candidatus Nanoarchaeia archaeon]
MTAYICRECNYRFESQLPRNGRKCPYCGKDRVREEPTVDELLMEE